jgi:hypothetical protein
MISPYAYQKGRQEGCQQLEGWDQTTEVFLDYGELNILMLLKGFEQSYSVMGKKTETRTYEYEAVSMSPRSCGMITILLSFGDFDSFDKRSLNSRTILLNP